MATPNNQRQIHVQTLFLYFAIMMVAFLSRGRAQLDVLNQSGAWDISP
jgi:hypothetical protein